MNKQKIIFVVQHNETRLKYDIHEVTDTSSGRLYWISGKSYPASAFTVLATGTPVVRFAA